MAAESTNPLHLYLAPFESGIVDETKNNACQEAEVFGHSEIKGIQLREQAGLFVSLGGHDLNELMDKKTGLGKERAVYTWK